MVAIGGQHGFAVRLLNFHIGTSHIRVDVLPGLRADIHMTDALTKRGVSNEGSHLLCGQRMRPANPS